MMTSPGNGSAHFPMALENAGPESRLGLGPGISGAAVDFPSRLAFARRERSSVAAPNPITAHCLVSFLAGGQCEATDASTTRRNSINGDKERRYSTMRWRRRCWGGRQEEGLATWGSAPEPQTAQPRRRETSQSRQVCSDAETDPSDPSERHEQASSEMVEGKHTPRHNGDGGL
jgi:hypothetical protein